MEPAMEFTEYEIEQEALGIILRQGYVLFEYMSDLKQEMFSAEPHKIIYRVMKGLAQDGNDPNLVLVRSTLKNKGLLENVGGNDYLDLLAATSGSEKSMYEYVYRIRNAFKKRSLLTINAGIPKALETRDADYVISRVNEGLTTLLTNAGGADVVSLSESLETTFKQIDERIKNPGIAGIKTGLGEVDFYTGGFLGGEVWYIGARPSMAKSALYLKLALNAAIQGQSVLLFNREMSPQRMDERLITTVSGVDAQKLRMGDISQAERKKLGQAKDYLDTLPIFIDHNYTGDIDYITSTIRKYHILHGIKMVGLDYIQLIVERTGDSVHELGRVSRAMKLISNELDITSIIISQVNRECEKRDNKRPLMADLRQSGNMEEDADIMVALYREEAYDENTDQQGVLEFIIRKARNGPTGTIRLKFDKTTVNINDGTELFTGAFA
jgi:replicative DNA helicase